MKKLNLSTNDKEAFVNKIMNSGIPSRRSLAANSALLFLLVQNEVDETVTANSFCALKIRSAFLGLNKLIF